MSPRLLALAGVVLCLLTACERGDATARDVLPEAMGGCPQVQVIGIRGQSQSLEHHRGLGAEIDGVVTRLEKSLASHDVDAVDVAAVQHRSRDSDDSEVYDADVNAGVDRFLTMLAEARDQCGRTALVVVGFSQGAQIAHKALAHHPEQADGIDALVLLGSPRHDPEAPVHHLDLPGPTAEHAGSLDAGPALGAVSRRTVSACLAADAVCNDVGAGADRDLTVHKHGYEKSRIADLVASAIVDRLV